MAEQSKVDILAILKEYTETKPKFINPPEEEKLLLLVKPINFDEAIRFSPGVSIFKAIYGRGKTYGIGYYTVHYCEQTKECDAIYINLREAKKLIDDYTNKVQDNIITILKGAIPSLFYAVYPILRLYNSPIYNALSSKGDLITTSNLKNKFDHKSLENAILNANKEDIVRVFFEKLAEEYISKGGSKLIVIYDEFEQLIPSPTSNVRYLADTIIYLLTSLRSEKGGVLDKYPGSFALVLTVQELVYPSEQMRGFRASVPPVVGKMIAAQDDLSIPIKFSLYNSDSIREYYEKALDLLEAKNIIKQDEKKLLLKISPCVGYYFSKLLKLPARLLFERLRTGIYELYLRKGQLMNLISTSQDDKGLCDTTENIFEEILRELIPDNEIYSLYTSKEITGLSKEQVLSMLKHIGMEITENRPDRLIAEVKANGYEGIVITYANQSSGTKLLMYKGRNVKLNEVNFKNMFAKHYGDYLTQFCTPKGKKEKECEILIIHPEEVNVIGAIVSINSISSINGIQIQKKVIDIPLDRDDLVSVLVKSLSKNASSTQPLFISGDMEYYEHRYNEVIQKIKKLESFGES